jgi:YD repeat-containing protein
MRMQTGKIMSHPITIIIIILFFFRVQAAEGHPVAYDYIGNLTRITDALSNSTAYQYDPMSRLTMETNCHRSLQKQPPAATSKAATVNGGFRQHYTFSASSLQA